MNISLEQQYERLNWRRKAYLYRQRVNKIILESKTGQIARIVAAYLVTGEADIPAYVILYLINEYGDKFFNSENFDLKLIPEHPEDVVAS